jgi:ribonuclease PH
MAKAVEAALLPAVVLESYPKAVISVHVNILQSSAHDTAAAISAASLALVDASVEMRDIVLSVMLRNDDVSVGPVFRCVVAAKTSTQDVSFLDFNGEVDALAMLQIVDGCKAQCTSLRSSVMQEFHQRS